MDLKPIMKTVSEWSTALIFGGFLAYFAMTFRRYKLVVESHQKLTDLMNDPKVRVAQGDQASHILKAV